VRRQWHEARASSFDGASVVSVGGGTRRGGIEEGDKRRGTTPLRLLLRLDGKTDDECFAITIVVIVTVAPIE
jgi:hypothetical protein